MGIALGAGELKVEQAQVIDRVCDCCGGPQTVVTGFVHAEGGGAVAAYVANLYPSCTRHEREVWIDAILGTWGMDDESDHVTFGAHCKAGQGCMLVPAAQADPDPAAHSIYGRRLSREEGLTHPWIKDFWNVVDAVLTGDPRVSSFWNSPGGELTG